VADDRQTPRVLIEHPNSLARLDLSEELRAAGYEVVTCAGPARRRGEPCPLLEGRPCSLVEDADVVVNALAADRARIYVGQRVTAPETTVLLLASEAAFRDLASILEGVEHAPTTTGGQELVALIDALRSTRRPEIDQDDSRT